MYTARDEPEGVLRSLWQRLGDRLGIDRTESADPREIDPVRHSQEWDRDLLSRYM